MTLSTALCAPSHFFTPLTADMKITFIYPAVGKKPGKKYIQTWKMEPLPVATFVFGFDHDTPASFDKVLEFSLKHRFFFAAFNHLLPLPGTALYGRLKQEKRFISEQWWLEPGYMYGKIPFLPKNMSPAELSTRCAEARKEFFTFSSICKRSIPLLARKIPPLLFLSYWMQNFNLRKEVDEKLGLPVGVGLDELPK